MSTTQIRLKNGIIIRQTDAKDAGQLEQLQVLVFPTLADEERFKAEHYRRHVELFPEGQFVAELDGRIVGMTTTIRYHFDFDAADHSFEEMIDGGWLSAHQPDGDWLYGLDIGVHPEFRRMGIGRALYQARQNLVQQLELRGQVTVGMPIGYGKVKDTMPAQTYFEKVRGGEIQDPTVSAQMRIGFRPVKLIPNYLHDPACDNYGVLIVWENEQGTRTDDLLEGEEVYRDPSFK